MTIRSSTVATSLSLTASKNRRISSPSLLVGFKQELHRLRHFATDSEYAKTMAMAKLKIRPPGRDLTPEFPDSKILAAFHRIVKKYDAAIGHLFASTFQNHVARLRKCESRQCAAGPPYRCRNGQELRRMSTERDGRSLSTEDRGGRASFTSSSSLRFPACWSPRHVSTPKHFVSVFVAATAWQKALYETPRSTPSSTKTRGRSASMANIPNGR